MRVRIIGRDPRNRSPRAIRLTPAPELMERRRLLATYHVVSPSDDGGVGTLRWAILQVNQDQDAGTIDFAIGGAGIQSIRLESPLPAITNSVSIDATQAGYAGGARIELDGSKLPLSSNGLILSSGSSTIRGLAINGFSGAGILLTGSDANVITGNYIGTDASGQGARPNGVGILISGSSRNTIGGDFGAGGNLISGNSGRGIAISSSVLSAWNVIQGNVIGLDSSGTRALPNRLDGIFLDHSSENTIGGTLAAAGNVISGNGGNGILIEADLGGSDSNLIAGNMIGVAGIGPIGLGNSGHGIALFGAVKTTIGGLSPRAGNVISGNQGNGLDLESATTSTLIQGNFLGTDRSGTIPIGNYQDGIYLFDSPSNTIGGTSFGSMNVISANLGNGIDAQGDSDGLFIQGNAIGTDPSAGLNLGNLSNGIYLLSSRNMIGGLEAGAGNTIANNGTGAVGTGIQVGDMASRNSFLSNSIYGNHRLGINLGRGPTENDDGDADTGGNGLQNYPNLALAQYDGNSTRIIGSLSSTPNTTFLVQFFNSPVVDMTGFGPGKYLIGSTSVETDDEGYAEFSAPGFDPKYGAYLTATATDPDGNTSEFSNAVAIQTVADLSLSLTADLDAVDVGAGLTYTLLVTNRSAVPAVSVTVTNTLADDVTIRSVRSTQGDVTRLFGNILWANLGTIAGGDSVRVTIVVEPQADAAGTISDTATVTSLSPDPDLSNNSKSVTTNVRSIVDLGVSIVPEGDEVRILGDTTFTITVDNRGPSDARDVLVRIPFDPSASFVSISSPSSVSVGDDGTIVVDLGNLAADSSMSFELTLRATRASGLIATAGVSSGDDDTNPSNDSASATVRVDSAADLVVEIGADRPTAYRGLDLTYTVVVRNDGPCDSTDVVLDHVLPDGAALISAKFDTGLEPVVDGHRLKAHIGALKSGAISTLTIVVRPAMDSSGPMIASAAVSSGLPELDPANNSGSLAIPVADASDLAVAVTSGPATAAPGQMVTYVLTVTNRGPGDDPGVELRYALPDGLSFASASSTQGAATAYSSGTLTAAIGRLESGRSATITVSAIPVAGSSGTLVGTVSVRGTNEDLDQSNNVATSILDVSPVDLGTQWVQGEGPIRTGDSFTLTAYVRNLGATRATNVAVSFSIGSLGQVIAAAPAFGQAAVVGGSVVASLGTLEAGSVAAITIQVRALAAGSMTSTLSVSADQFNVDADQGIASITSVIQESAGAIGFASASGWVLTTAGYATIPVFRDMGTAGTVTVNYQTVAGSAVPWRDFIPASGTLIFLPGQTSQTIQIPVLATPHSLADYTVSVVLSAATAGAVLGARPSAVLTIHDPSPDTVSPRINDLSLDGPGKSITSVSFRFSEALATDMAVDPRSFRLVDLGPDGRLGTADDQAIPTRTPSYDPASHSVTIDLLSPLPPNRYFGIEVAASGPGAIHDLAGNPLDGSGTGQGGTAYAALFARGSNLNYRDSAGNSVNLRLRGPGFIDQIRDANGDGQSLVLRGVAQGRSTLSGSVKRGRAGSGSTQLGTIDGLGSFGQVRVKLTSPAFVVRAYPFQQASRNQPLAPHAARAGVRHSKPRPLLRHPKRTHRD